MSQKEMLAEYYGLLFDCPMDHESYNCAFHEIRTMPLPQRLKYFRSLSQEEQIFIISEHIECIKHREHKARCIGMK